MKIWQTFFALLFLSNFGCAALSQSGGGNRLMVEKSWVRNTLAKEHVGSRRQHHFDPILFKDTVIQANGIDGIVAYDKVTASVRWRLKIENGVESSAALEKDTLYFGASDGNIYAAQATDGKVLWTFPIRSEGLAKPLVSSGFVYVLAGNNIIYALDATTGRSVWSYTRRDPSSLSIRGGSQPNISDGVVYVGFSDGFLVALKSKDGAVAWEASLNKNRRFRDVDSHPVIDGERIYIASYDNGIHCLQKSDGKLLWTVEVGGQSAPLVSGPNLYFSSSTGEILALDKASGKVLWKVRNGGGISGPPTIYKNLLVFGEYNGSLNFADILTGRLINEFSPGWGVHSAPVIDEENNRLFVMSGAANLFSLKLVWRKHHRVWPWDEGV